MCILSAIIYYKPFDKFTLSNPFDKEEKEVDSSVVCGEGVDGWEPGDKKYIYNTGRKERERDGGK